MDTTGSSAWGQVLQKMESGTLEDVGSINQRADVREEKWSSLDMKQLKCPQSTVSSVKRSTVIQYFEADFV